ncbi:DUF4221 family protein [Roseivirga echinicomitans]|uniref:Lipoprotein n=1 Tax=Roseivirga echinicomitans TaxID=296218 RepID=A0A150XY48_9BACT|nr:DUF4221 family protein [Roseivirga echinicomitans]KYG83700.1 hypothetical protein AWN68_02520 [Roseivirga echinicomitans]
MRYNPIKTLLAILFLSSCGGTEKSEKTDNTIAERKPLEIIDKGLKTFTLDDEINFERLIDLKFNTIEGVDYLTFFDRASYSIYMYDYKQPKPIRRIQLEKVGPNRIHEFFNFQFFFHAMDSILIRVPMMGHYLINGKAEVIDKKEAKGSGVFQNEIRKASFDDASYYENGKINTLWTSANQGENQEQTYLRAIIDWKNDSIVSKSISANQVFSDYPKIKEMLNRKDKTFIPIKVHFLRSSEFLFASTPISDSIFLFKDNQRVKSIYAGKPNCNIADYETFLKLREIKNIRSGSSGSVSKVQEPIHPPYYGDNSISPDGKYIYRVLSHGTKPLTRYTRCHWRNINCRKHRNERDKLFRTAYR